MLKIVIKITFSVITFVKAVSICFLFNNCFFFILKNQNNTQNTYERIYRNNVQFLSYICIIFYL